MKYLINNRLLLISALACLGFFVDFLFVAIIRINAWPINGTAYLVVAITIGSQLIERYGRRDLVVPALLAYVIALGLAHIVMTNRTSTSSFEMTYKSDSPLIFSSKDWPQNLLVKSEKLEAQSAHFQSSPVVTIETVEVSTYGCITSYKVRSVAGVDVLNDPESTWVWKTDKTATTPTRNWPGFGDQDLLWCPKKSD